MSKILFAHNRGKSKEPLVAVVIPCFNYGKYVIEAVNSVLNQTLQQVEIIVVDGGSDDGFTPEVVRSIKHPKVSVYCRKGRHLVGDNRNFGISKSNAPYVCCLDADDTLEPTYLEKAIYMMEMYSQDIVSTSITLMKPSSEVWDVLKHPTLRSLVKANRIATCAVFRRTYWERSGGYYDAGLGKDHVAEDWDLWIRFAALGARIGNIADERLFNYRTHVTTSLSTMQGTKSYAEQLKLIKKRNKQLLTPAAFKNSTLQNKKKIVRTLSKTDLFKVAKKANAAPKTLMIVQPFLMVGGAERLLSELTGYLVRKGWKVIVVSTNPYDLSFGDTADWFRQHTHEVYNLPRFLEPDGWKTFLEYLIYTKHPSCIINAGSTLFYQMTPEIKKKNPNTALIDFLFNTIGHTASHTQFRKYFDFALAESSEVYDWFLRAGWKKTHVRQVASGINLQRYLPKERSLELVQKLKIHPKDIVIGFSGRLSEEKSPEVFLEIAALCKGIPNVRFIMTGAGPMYDIVLQHVLQLPKNVRFDFLGKVEDIQQVFSLNDLLILPSKLDGRPFVVLEALASGIPVIASCVGGLPEIIKDGVNGYLCAPAKPKGFAAVIRVLTKDIKLLTKMKAAARHYAEQHLDSEQAFHVYQEVLSGAVTKRVIDSGLPKKRQRYFT